MKVKTFYHKVESAQKILNVESAINYLIKDKEVVDIKQSIAPNIIKSGSSLGVYVVTTVLYNEKTK